MTIEQELAELRTMVGHLKDRQDVLDCIQRESRARDRQDSEQIAGCWWDDGVDEHGAVVTFAPDYPAQANAGHAAAFNATSHSITNHLCEIEGDSAYCESYVIGGRSGRTAGRPRSASAAISTSSRSAAANGASRCAAARSR